MGTWTDAQGAQAVFTEDHLAQSQVKSLTIEATWSVGGDSVVITPKTLNGRAVAELKARALPRMASLSPQARQVVEDLDKPDYMLLSSDGKTITTDKSKYARPRPEPAQTLRKVGA